MPKTLHVFANGPHAFADSEGQYLSPGLDFNVADTPGNRELAATGFLTVIEDEAPVEDEKPAATRKSTKTPEPADAGDQN